MKMSSNWLITTHIFTIYYHIHTYRNCLYPPSGRSLSFRTQHGIRKLKKTGKIDECKPFIYPSGLSSIIMTNVTQRRVQQLCSCRVKLYAHQKKRTKDYCKRKRQAFVYNAEEEIWHEPYMQSLRREFSDESVLCDSKIELPWKDIALPVAGMKIRPDVTLTSAVDQQIEEVEVHDEADETEKKDSTGVMPLPWKYLLITETLEAVRAPDDPETCDSSVEIPWDDLILDKPMEIQPPREENACESDDVEIPWERILVPHNIVIESDKKKKHPSSGQPPRTRGDTACVLCGTNPCCTKSHVYNATVISTCI